MNNNNSLFPNTLDLFPAINNQQPMTTDQILNELIAELNKSTATLKSETSKLFYKYEQNNKRIISKYAAIYNKNKNKNNTYLF